MMDRVLPILIPVTALALLAFAVALCKAAARADVFASRERPEGRDSGERAARSALIAVSPVFAKNGAPAIGESPAGKAPVFLVDERADRERSIEIRLTTNRVRAEVKRARDSRPTCARRARDGGRLRPRYRHGRYRQLSDRTRSLGLWGAGGDRRGPRRLDR